MYKYKTKSNRAIQPIIIKYCLSSTKISLPVLPINLGFHLNANIESKTSLVINMEVK